MSKNPVSLLPSTAMLFLSAILAQAAPEAVVVATVNGNEISDTEFEQTVYSVGRSSMYHGRPTEDEQYLRFRRDVLEQLVERRLLLHEARRRGLMPDQSKIQDSLAIYEKRYSSTERWQREGDQMLASLRSRFEEDELLALLEEQIREIDGPSETELQEYYALNPQSFTEPKQDRVSVILLGLSPSAGAAAWRAAREEAEGIVRRVRDGADFSELARMHSSDVSANAGGDMGYLHDGMLSFAAQAAVDSLDVGDVSPPITVLEGIALFRLVDRKQPELHPFDHVRERAAGLWRRTRADRQWQELLDGLHNAADVQINEDYFARIPVAR